MSEVDKALRLEIGVGSIQCKDRPKEECLCFDGIAWEYAAKVPRVNSAGIYTGEHYLDNSEAKKAIHEAKVLLDEQALKAKELKRQEVNKFIEDNFEKLKEIIEGANGKLILL